MILVFVSTYSIGTACTKYSKYPIEGANLPFAWFYSDQCFLQFDPNFVKSIMIVNGYLTADYIVTKYWYLDPNKLTW